MSVKSKYIFIVFLFAAFITFNCSFFYKIKQDMDLIVKNHIYPIASSENKARLDNVLSRPYYLKSDIDELGNVAFYSYKDSLMNRNLLVEKLKNVLLLNVKIVLVDNIESRFVTYYGFNIILFILFLFVILFKEEPLGERRYEPKVDIA